MKKFLVMTIVSVISAGAFAAGYTPMNIVEKSSYQLAGLVTKGKIDASFLTDVNHLTVSSDASGFHVQMTSPATTPDAVNTLDITFDTNGKATSFSSNFVARFSQGPIFEKTNAATILDLCAEAFVDHLSESQDNLFVAQNVESIDLGVEQGGFLILVHLKNAQVYQVHMDATGKVISKGF